MTDKHTSEALSIEDAIAVVLGTLNGNSYGLTVEDQLEALRMACRELEASNAPAALAAAREALTGMAEEMEGWIVADKLIARGDEVARKTKWRTALLSILEGLGGTVT